ncbi:MAG: FAD-binding oxidoreductase, partial [Elusimicrobiota bacterium]|nr:FAD-binding oxidoreductase [Elusimicrobiota bacterium]
MKKVNKFSKALMQVKKIIGRGNVLLDDVALALNSFDGSPVRARPDAVLNIASAAKLAKVIKALATNKIPFTPRMAASNHDGGCIALRGGCVLNLTKLNKIISINTEEGFAIVESGVVNQDLQNALALLGYFYAPDPGSMQFSTIGGNAALNAGGAKTLKYGSTASNLLKVEIITPEGEIMLLDRAANGPDLAALLTRSEGTLCLITKLWVKILPSPKKFKTILAYF